MDSKVMMTDRDVYLKYGVGKSQIRRDDELNLTQRRRGSNATMNRDRIEGTAEFVYSGDEGSKQRKFLYGGYTQIRHDGDGMSRSVFSQNRFMQKSESKVVIKPNRWETWLYTDDAKIDREELKLFDDGFQRSCESKTRTNQKSDPFISIMATLKRIEARLFPESSQNENQEMKLVSATTQVTERKKETEIMESTNAFERADLMLAPNSIESLVFEDCLDSSCKRKQVVQKTDLVVVETTQVKELQTYEKETIQHEELICGNQVWNLDLESNNEDSVLEIFTKNVNDETLIVKDLHEHHDAHQVFDTMLNRKQRVCHRKKVSLSPKSWKFKYKPKEVRIKRAHYGVLYVAFLFELEQRVIWLRRTEKRKSESLAMEFSLDDDQFQVKHKWRFKLFKPVSDLTLAAKSVLYHQRSFHGSSHIFFANSSLRTSLFSWGKVVKRRTKTEIITQMWLQAELQQFTNGVLTSQEENKWSFKHVGVLSKFLGDDRELILPHESTLPQIQVLFSVLEPGHRSCDKLLVNGEHLADAIVRDIWVHIQRDATHEKRETHHLFERLLLTRHILFKKSVLSKSWMFKYKSRIEVIRLLHVQIWYAPIRTKICWVQWAWYNGNETNATVSSVWHRWKNKVATKRKLQPRGSCLRSYDVLFAISSLWASLFSWGKVCKNILFLLMANLFVHKRYLREEVTRTEPRTQWGEHVQPREEKLRVCLFGMDLLETWEIVSHWFETLMAGSCLHDAASQSCDMSSFGMLELVFLQACGQACFNGECIDKLAHAYYRRKRQGIKILDQREGLLSSSRL